jgi:hypothetical protein
MEEFTMRAQCKARITLLMLVACASLAADSHVVTSADIQADSLSADDLRSVFLCTKTFLPGGRAVEPVLVKDSATHRAFLLWLGKTDNALQLYYRSLVFTGRGTIPKTFATEGEAMAYAAKRKGVVVYVTAPVPMQGVNKIELR